MKKKIVVGMSGGVDSSTLAALLLEEGYDVSGITMKIWDGNASYLFDKGKHACYGPGKEKDLEDTINICKQIGIDLKIIDLSNEFKTEVLDYFKKEYMNGKTPNPCVVCNRKLKFGLLLEKTIKSGIDFDFFATGHYARIYKTDTGRFQLQKAVDSKKDQTYFLYSLNSRQLSKTMFPLGNYTKDEIKKLSEKFGLNLTTRQESQNFITGGHSRIFEKNKIKNGNIVDKDDRILGKHNGIINYTIGQRRGLGISSKNPLYVIKIDIKNNNIIVGEKNDLLKNTAVFDKTFWNTDIDITKTFKVYAKIRYAHREAPVTVQKNGEEFKAIFDSPQMSITPGQSIVFYYLDRVIGGGIIKY